MSEIRIRVPKLHTTQEQVRTEAKRFNVLDCGRRWGKTQLCHDLILETALDAGAPVAYMTPTYKMLSEVWRDISELLAPVVRDKSEQERRLETVTGGVVDMWSLDNADAVRGRAYKRVIIDEAASVRGLEEAWNTVVRPTLIDLRGDAWFPSTPKGMNGFYKLHLLGRDPANTEWQSWHYTSYDNPHLDPAELDQMRATMTEREYRQEILAEFLEGEGVVFRNIDACMLAPVTSPEKHAGHTLVAGVDWGKENDFTAISIGCHTCKAEVMLDRFNQIDYYFQRQRLQAAISRWGVTSTIVESNSIGTPILEQLQRDGVRVAGFQTTLISKAALIEALSLAIEQAAIQFQPDQAGRAELEAYERTTTETGMSKYSAPAGMHDDTVIARALMWRAVQNAPRQARPAMSDDAANRLIQKLRTR
jgi:hypothetical protein